MTHEDTSVLLILPSHSRRNASDIRKGVIPIFVGPKSGSHSIRNPLALFEILSEFGPNVIHTWYAGDRTALVLHPVVLLYSRMTGCPIISTIWEPLPRPGLSLNPLMRAEMRLEVKSASHIVTDTAISKKIIEEFYGVHRAKIDIIPHFEWDADLFTRWRTGGAKEEQWILFFGRVAKNKGLEYLIRAEPLITKEFPSARIVIAGSGQEDYHKGITNRDAYILLDHYVGYREAAMLFQKSAIVVLPYTYATVSGILPVAYAFRKPVVATSIGGFLEVVEDGRTGILVPPRNPEALAQAITSLLRDSTLRSAIGEAGYSKLTNELSWAVTAAKLMSLYREQELVSVG